MAGHGPVSIVPTGWKSPDGGAAFAVSADGTLTPAMGARAYFADACTAGTYSNEQYAALNLLGKTLRFKTDLTGVGCGCNAAFYLVSMRQNTQPSECFDYYCDANNVCGESCAEIDIMEANQFAWHSTLHTSQDHNGKGSGYGGGDTYNGPRDWSGSQYAPGGSCIDTAKPFDVAVSFPVDAQGTLTAMEVVLTQDGHSCPLKASVNGYAGMPELTAALKAGMTPVVSYWGSDQMLWMDGKGADGQGPCASDNSAACAASAKFSDFSLESIAGQASAAAAGSSPAPALPAPALSGGSGGAKCPGEIKLAGHGPVSIVPTGWKSTDGGASFDVLEGSTLVPHMGARAYFADGCTAGTYSNEQYMALNLLGKTLKFTTDLGGAGCGCNAAFYLVSMRQNTEVSECHDYYCDANNVCGVSCAEIDIMEANQFAWHSTLHTSHDHNGKGSGYGGGDGYNGPRDFSGSQFGPGGSCIDTSKPFDVAVSFPVDAQGTLTAMEVILTQDGHSCPLKASVSGYAGMMELTAALKAGMTPVVSYWSSDQMLWMDGKGADGQGPCAGDNAGACPATVRMYDFSLGAIGGQGGAQPAGSPGAAPAVQPVETPEADATAKCPGKISLPGHGPVSIVPTGWSALDSFVPLDVHSDGSLVPHMGSRAYFADGCTAGRYSNEEYLALNLLGKTMRFTADLSGSGCGCNAAFYLVSMHQNTEVSDCHDYYCDANNVCGVSCAEIDIMEANQFAWHSTLHTYQDHNGVGVGYGGGGAAFSGPRDFSASQFGPGASCIDTSKPFEVDVSFPVDGQGTLTAMEVALSQAGQGCPLKVRIGSYAGMAELSAALKAGMTPVVSYWSSDNMLWMDGKGADGQGPCASDNAAACSDSVKLSGFSVRDIGAPVPPSQDGGSAAAAAGGAGGAAGAADESALYLPGLGAWDGVSPEQAMEAGAAAKGLLFAGSDFPASAAQQQGAQAEELAGELSGQASTCPGKISMKGYGEASLVPTGWHTHSGGSKVDVLSGGTIAPHMGSRAYFAEACTAGVYNHGEYLALNLLGKTLRYTADLSGAGCGCNVGVYLVSMRQNDQPSECYDYYCDASKVCGVSCAEIDVMEANQYAWHSTLHTADDSRGAGGGYGGGDGYGGPRDWHASDYAPGAACIDTSKAFDVAIAFPVDAQGTLTAMQVTLSQDGHSCKVSTKIGDYAGMAELSAALVAGMTPVVSYWSSDNMLWLDGKGDDGRGACAKDDAAACPRSVKLSGFSVEPLEEQTAAAGPGAVPQAPQVAEAPTTVEPAPAKGGACPGDIAVPGHGAVSIVPTGWADPKGGAAFEVLDKHVLVPHMGARAYFAERCTAGTYSNEQYSALNLLGKTMRFTVDLSDAGCGCNAALYLVSMRQNSQVSDCKDYYCDANDVCGVSCAEIDIMEANQFAWHSTLHTSHDHNGVGGGYGGGDGFNGPRDWSAAQYGPGASCIDTAKPFSVEASFPVDAQGTMTAMKVTLSQDGGQPCHVSTTVGNYAGMAELTAALKAGMTPVASYWSSDQMLWMDGKGSDGQGPCASDNSGACPETVKFYGFSWEDIGAPAGPAQPVQPSQPPAGPAEQTPAAVPGQSGLCPGSIDVSGNGPVAIVPTGWGTPDGGAKFEVLGGRMLVPHMGARAYFADRCTAGSYDHGQYMALNLLGKSMRFTVDLAGAGCGCNAALYLVSMRQNTQVSDCHDYYCDANNVCGVSCAEIDIMEANQFAWHSTLHTSHDHNGVGGGYGGGDGFNGPRDWLASQYAPGSTCIDTAKPFDVKVSFPVDGQGTLAAMLVTLSQDGRSCSVSTKVSNYPGMAELTNALRAGMTPVVSYWSSDKMLWMDGKGSDGQGPCAGDNSAACPDTVKMYGFSVEDLGSDAAGGQQVTTTGAAAGPPAPAAASGDSCPGEIDLGGHGHVSLIPTGWGSPGGGAALEVLDGGVLVPHMGARAYFADTCTAGAYDYEQYMAWKLLGKRVKYTVDLSGAGCGCNVAFYLVSMRQNSKPSECHDYYCDANKVCGVSCAEIDIMEANQFSWHSTLHSAHDHNGVGGGYGGGDGFNGPRDWDGSQYGPGGSCIDTSKPLSVTVAFPVDGQGQLQSMDVELSQEGHSCTVSAHVGNYPGMAELSAALAAGMTPVVSYWSSDEMLWMDGKGSDGQGPCASDNSAACPDSVKLSGFSVESIGASAGGGGVQDAGALPAGPAATDTVAAGSAAGSNGAVCPGAISLVGHGPTSIVPTGWQTPKGGATFSVLGDQLVPHMGARAYFADACTAGSYDHGQYLALDLLGKALRFTVDLAGVGCGCNAAFYLVSMHQNTQVSDCHDYYCDANNVCGVSCAEIDIMEANQFAWHSTLHSAHDHNGVGGGYGGGDGYNGPRDWGASQYAPGAQCIDTAKPFNVEAAFPVDAQGTLSAMQVTLSQDGRSCSLSTRIGDYAGMAELTAALKAGMTPVVSYWSSDEMLWMDGKGSDGLGPCVSDHSAACPDTVKFYGFSLESLGGSSTTAGGVFFAGQDEAVGIPAGGALTTTGLFLAGGGAAAVALPTVGPAAAGADGRAALELLHKEASAIAKAAKAEVQASTSFNCQAGLANWELGWSDMKKQWCCAHEKIGCPSTTPPLALPPAAPQPAIGQPAAGAAAATGCSSAYQQCGGQGWSGPSCCEAGCTCNSHGDYYSQCVPPVGSGTCAAQAPASDLVFMKKTASTGPGNAPGSGRQISRAPALLGLLISAAVGSAAALVAGLRCKTRHAAAEAATAGRAAAYERAPALPTEAA